MSEVINKRTLEESAIILNAKLPWLKDTEPAELLETRSQTFRAATRFFPEAIRSQIQVVYAFVRVPDDLVDVPKAGQAENLPAYHAYKSLYTAAWQQGVTTDFPVIDNFVSLARELDFPPEWSTSFFTAMEMDIHPTAEFASEEELLSYTYGSAAVIGLMCARVFGMTDTDALAAAAKLGDAFQHINFIRDANYDLSVLARHYFPRTDYDLLGVEPQQNLLDLGSTSLSNFVQLQADRFETWLNQGLVGINSLAKHSAGIAIPVLTAALLYEKVAHRIRKEPELILSSRVSPTSWDKLLALLQASTYVVTQSLFLPNLYLQVDAGRLKLKLERQR